MPCHLIGFDIIMAQPGSSSKYILNPFNDNIIPRTATGSPTYVAATKEETNDSKKFILADHTKFRDALEEAAYVQPSLLNVMPQIIPPLLRISSSILIKFHTNQFNSVLLESGVLLIIMSCPLMIKILILSTIHMPRKISSFASAPRWLKNGFRSIYIRLVGSPPL